MTGQDFNKWIERMSPSIDEDVFPARGGTEIMMEGLNKYTTIGDHNINILLSTPDPNNLRFTKRNVLWQHLNFDDESVAIMSDKSFTNNLDATVYVSNWQFEKYRYFHNIPLSKSFVIKNAIENIDFEKREKSEKIKLIYTSAPFRGLDLLLESFSILDRDDVELDIYSSNDVYGSGYKNFVGNAFDHIFERAKSMKNVNYIGYANNNDVKNALKSAHIFAYPSTFEETCCLAMIEAGAAGCNLVTTNLGALYETGSEYATLVPVRSTAIEMVKSYADALNNAIDAYWSKDNQQLIKKQSEYFNEFYSWDRRSVEWNQLFDRIS